MWNLTVYTISASHTILCALYNKNIILMIHVGNLLLYDKVTLGYDALYYTMSVLNTHSIVIFINSYRHA